jgi:hypothetical protein
MENKTTVIIPAAGMSSRYPNMRPKWLLTHPSGKLMLELAVQTLIERDFDFVLVTTEELSNKYEVPIILEQLFKGKIKLVTIPYQTSGPVETISFAITQLKLKNQRLIIKDVDNFVDLSNLDLNEDNFCVGVDINKIEIDRISNKSFIISDHYNIIQEIVEKKIKSNTISVGVYGFHSAEEFMKEANELLTLPLKGEIFVSHVISSLILDGKVFSYLAANDYKDWGTFHEWYKEVNSFQTLFCDFDGVLVENKGKFGSNNWFTHTDKLILDNIEVIRNLVNSGATLVITTARPTSEEQYISTLLRNNGILNFKLICGLPHSRRILINDYSNTNPYPSAIAVSMERNSVLKPFLTQHIANS